MTNKNLRTRKWMYLILCSPTILFILCLIFLNKELSPSMLTYIFIFIISILEIIVLVRYEKSLKRCSKLYEMNMARELGKSDVNLDISVFSMFLIFFVISFGIISFSLEKYYNWINGQGIILILISTIIYFVLIIFSFTQIEKTIPFIKKYKTIKISWLIPDFPDGETEEELTYYVMKVPDKKEEDILKVILLEKKKEWKKEMEAILKSRQGIEYLKEKEDEEKEKIKIQNILNS